MPQDAGGEFLPSRRLQEMFEQYIEASDTDTDTSSEVDYDALVFDGEEATLFENLTQVSVGVVFSVT